MRNAVLDAKGARAKGCVIAAERLVQCHVDALRRIVRPSEERIGLGQSRFWNSRDLHRSKTSLGERQEPLISQGGNEFWPHVATQLRYPRPRQAAHARNPTGRRARTCTLRWSTLMCTISASRCGSEPICSAPKSVTDLPARAIQWCRTPRMWRRELPATLWLTRHWCVWA